VTTEEERQILRDAANALALLPPMLKEQYVELLRLYAEEPWRLGGRCHHCSEPIYQTPMGRWRHTNGMYVCAVQLPKDKRRGGWRAWRAEPVVGEPSLPKLDKTSEP
jgi:hypothetical protein